MGTYVYSAPEYVMNGQLSVKSDVYSSGVVVLELITGRKVIDSTRPEGEQKVVAWVNPHCHLFIHIAVSVYSFL